MTALTRTAAPASAADVEGAYARALRAVGPWWVWAIILCSNYIVDTVFAFVPNATDEGEMPYLIAVLSVVVLFVAWRARHELRTIIRGCTNLPLLAAIVIIGALAAKIPFFIAARELLPFARPHFVMPDSLYFIAVAPVSEEIRFQLGMQTWLQRLGPIAAMVVTTAVFAALHTIDEPDPLMVFAAQFFSLAIFALIRQYTKSLGAAMAVHGLNNLMGALLHLPDML